MEFITAAYVITVAALVLYAVSIGRRARREASDR